MWNGVQSGWESGGVCFGEWREREQWGNLTCTVWSGDLRGKRCERQCHCGICQPFSPLEVSRCTEFASGFCPGGDCSLSCTFHFTEYVPPLPPIFQGQTVSPSHVVALSHVPCHGTISIPCHGTISIPCHGTISIPCHGTISIPYHGTISIPCHGTISIPCHGTISIPCHVSLTLSDDVVCTVWFLYVGCVMYIPLQDKNWEGWLINPVIVLCGNYSNKVCVQYSSLFH